jgi:peptide/nickel transport system substrate-binding protein
MKLTRPLVNRRWALGLAAAGLAAPYTIRTAAAQARDRLVISYPVDVASWDPIAHTFPLAMSIWKSVFDSPLTQTPDLQLAPNVITSWRWTDPLALEVNFRSDVVFHNGDPLTAEDFKFSFDERPKADTTLAIAGVWNRTLRTIDVVSPTQAVMRFSAPNPTAAPWLAFLGSYIMPKRYFEQVGGKPGFLRAPIGSGPYKLAEYQQNSRIVLEAFDRYWGGRPRIPRVVFEIVRDPTARVAAIQSRAADISVQVPIREAERLGAVAGLTSRIEPTTEIMLLQMPNTGALLDRNVRLAMHHAINKEAISRALFAGRAVPLSLPATPGTPGDIQGYTFPYSEDRARELLAASHFNAQNPAHIKFLTTNGAFPNDYDVARALQQMWRRVGIEAEIEVIELSKYFELNHNGELPGPCLYSWANSTGDPEIYAGYMLNPDLRFSAWKSDDMRDRMRALFAETDQERRFAGYRDTGRYAIEQGYNIPLLQSVTTLVHVNGLNFQAYRNGWVLPAAQSWS